jgi:hypothetical protein
MAKAPFLEFVASLNQVSFGLVFALKQNFQLPEHLSFG